MQIETLKEIPLLSNTYYIMTISACLLLLLLYVLSHHYVYCPVIPAGFPSDV